MKLKISDLLSAKDALIVINQAKLPVKTSYSLSRSIKKIAEELEHFSEQHLALIKEYGEEGVEGGSWKVKPENMAEFSKRYDELLDVEVDIDVWKLPLEDSVWGNLEITPETAARVWFIFDIPA